MIEHLNEDSFRTKIFDYTKDKDFKYIGTLPAIIDFYAEWCGPCKMVAPILDELAKEYDDKIIIYKINTEKEEHLSTMFGIRSIPTFLFIPLQGEIRIGRGAMSKVQFEQIISDVFDVPLPEVEHKPGVDNFVDDFQDTSTLNINDDDDSENKKDFNIDNKEMSDDEKDKLSKENFIKGDAE